MARAHEPAEVEKRRYAAWLERGYAMGVTFWLAFTLPVSLILWKARS